jgi:lactate permease
MPINDLSAMNGRILPIMSVIVPLWLVRAMVPWRETLEVLPAILVSGLSFAVTQFVWANYIDVGLVDIIAGAASLILTSAFLKFWKPKTIWRYPEEKSASAVETTSYTRGQVCMAWMPFVILFAFVVGWGVMRTNQKLAIDQKPWANVKMAFPGLDQQVLRVPPVEEKARAESAVYELKWFSSAGTSVLFACILTALLLRQRARHFGRSFLSTCRRMVVPLLAIVPMLGLAYVTRYSGTDAILGLAFTRTGIFYPFFGTFLGWLGVALTGSDTASNALFGSLQKITSEQLKIDPVLMCSANSAGGVMGKMVDAQSIVVAATAANLTGQEGSILLKVLWHSVALTAIVGVIVLVYAYLLSHLIPHGIKLIG